MRTALRTVAVLVGAGLASVPAAVHAKPAAEITVAFLAPAEGPDAVRASEFALGAKAALAELGKGAPTVRMVEQSLPEDAPALAKSVGALAKAKTAIALVWAPDGRTAAVEKAAEKAKLPLLVVSPEPTRPDRNPKRAVFWAGGVRPDDAALSIMDFLFQPIGSKDPTLLHDGSARALLTLAKCRAQHHVNQRPKEPQVVAEGFAAADAKRLAGAGTDAFLYCGGPAGAERLLAAAREAKLEIPVLLGQGLVTTAVPSFHQGTYENGWALAPAWFEDFKGPAQDAHFALKDAAKADGKNVLPLMVRGFRTMAWVLETARAAGDPRPKRFVPHLRRIVRRSAQNKPVFAEWGHATLARLQGWRSAAVREEPACHRVRPTYLPMEDTPQVGFFTASRYEWEPGTQYIWCSWEEGTKRTIERDLAALGLGTKGYEADLEKRILDDLLGRVMGRLNRLFLRNVDGTSIPGISYRISFTAEPPPKTVKGAKVWNVRIAGDSQIAGGMASGNDAFVFSTYIQRTMYVKRALKPPISATDRQYITGHYKWGTSVDQNIRDGLVRALVDGYSQAMGLTGAHELGHIAGCSHDTVTPRSIMNVAEGAGLEFSWATWVRTHQQLLEKRLGRVPAPKR